MQEASSVPKANVDNLDRFASKNSPSAVKYTSQKRMQRSHVPEEYALDIQFIKGDSQCPEHEPDGDSIKRSYISLRVDL